MNNLTDYLVCILIILTNGTSVPKQFYIKCSEQNVYIMENI